MESKDAMNSSMNDTKEAQSKNQSQNMSQNGKEVSEKKLGANQLEQPQNQIQDGSTMNLYLLLERLKKYDSLIEQRILNVYQWGNIFEANISFSSKKFREKALEFMEPQHLPQIGIFC